MSVPTRIEQVPLYRPNIVSLCTPTAASARNLAIVQLVTVISP
jgi:hypothetical protein